MAVKKQAKPKGRADGRSGRPVGNDGHRDEEVMLAQREEAYRLHTFEGWSMRQIALHHGISVATVKNDVDQYRKMLRDELPTTFEAWQTKLWVEYQTRMQEAQALWDESNPGSLVRAQALKMKIELTQSIERLFGVNKGVKAPMPGEEDRPDEVTWE